jgi:hypothetical protein
MVVGRETRWWPFIVWLWQAQQVQFNRQQVGQGTGSILGLARSTRFNFQRSLARSGSSSILKFEKFHGSKPGCHTTRYVHTGTCTFASYYRVANNKKVNYLWSCIFFEGRRRWLIHAWRAKEIKGFVIWSALCFVGLDEIVVGRPWTHIHTLFEFSYVVFVMLARPISTTLVACF